MLFDVIRQLRDEGVAVVFVSHKLDELYAVCDQVTVMQGGTVAMARWPRSAGSSSWPPCSGETWRGSMAGGARDPHAGIMRRHEEALLGLRLWPSGAACRT